MSDAVVCGKSCAHGSECLLLAGHTPCNRHESQHGCVFFDAGPAPDHILQFFATSHLPPHLQDVSRHFGDLATLIVAMLPGGPERTVALRKLLESKDAAVRALVAKDGAQ